MKRTFIDAGVLIAAARGDDPLSARALEILDDPERQFLSSLFLRLEVLPKAAYYRRADEVAFYQAFFRSVSAWADAAGGIAELAYQEACAHGLGALDALHVAAAVLLHADELVTTERPSKPLHRSKSVKIVSIYPGSGIEFP